MNEIESMLLEIADRIQEQTPDEAQQIHTAIERLREWREKESARQATKRAAYTEAMMAYVNSTSSALDEEHDEWRRRERDRIARMVATDKRWSGTYIALCELLSA